VPLRPKFSTVAAPIEKPLPLWILYPLFFVLVYVAHWPLLRLPYFWDEAGYYIPAALDYFRTGSLIPHSTLTNAHPPLPSILLAAWWHVSGLAINGTRTFLCMVAALAFLGVFRLARVLVDTLTAAIVTFLTAIYPVWFAQSTLAHADLFAAAFTLWALSFYFERYTTDEAPCTRTLLLAATLFSLAALSKETAIVTPVALALWEITLLLTERVQKTAHAAWAVALATPILPLALWYLYHYRRTGFTFGNPEFLRYNASANMSATRILLSLWHRIVHLTVHMNLYVPVVATLAVLLIPRLPIPTRFRSRLSGSRPALTAIVLVIAANALAFSVLGGALLTRYLLPLYPLVILLCVLLWRSRGAQILVGLTALTSIAFLAGLWINPPYSIAPEDNLTYRNFVVLHQQAIALIAHQFPYATVLTAWPATTELEHPDLGYTRIPIKTVGLDNFSLDQIQRAAADPGAYDTALVFSTKWNPPGINLGKHTQASDTAYYDYHRDLAPPDVAKLLHGDIIWYRYIKGEWAAVLRFPRSNEARLALP
jgi:4-amino-4-deoxy-L-arabinose transferase-like glycosyltransferase